MSAATTRAEPAPVKARTGSPDPWGGDRPDEPVEIPREPTWLQEFAGQRVRVPLPIEAYPRRVVLPLVSLHQLAAAALLLLPPVWCAVDLLDPGPSGLDAWEWAVMAPLAAFTLAAGGILASMGLVGLFDTLRPGPAVALDENGICDERTGLRVAWTNVASLVILRDRKRGKIASLLLRTQAGPPRRSVRHPFRFGTPLDFWLVRRRKIIVPLWFLSPGSHVLAHAAAELVQRTGGRALDMADLLPSHPFAAFALRVRLRKPRAHPRPARS